MMRVSLYIASHAPDLIRGLMAVEAPDQVRGVEGFAC